ncbi:MAG: isoprenylcysteine carboxyl methyltransferase family protein [Proteobacteria bacterium]|nr:isoprenylcysteine carboxyl methyltransferase family protein [Pseudomonadota bacterium]
MGLTALERLAELVVSKRNLAWSLTQGGVEHGFSHFPFMVVLHTAFLIGCVAEPWLMDRPFVPWLGWPCLVLAVACQGLRWWCITTLGQQWNTRVVIVPGMERVTGGPYRYFNHPNYVAVVVEGLVLPLIHTAWLTAAIFTVLNALLLTVRIHIENQALASLETA